MSTGWQRYDGGAGGWTHPHPYGQGQGQEHLHAITSTSGAAASGQDLGYGLPQGQGQGLGPGQGHFPCARCGKVYLHLPSLWNHKAYQCGKEPQFACQVCGRRFKFKAHRKRHLLKQHGLGDGAPSRGGSRGRGRRGAGAGLKFNLP